MDLLDNLPRALTATGPRGLAWWQWLSLPVIASIVGLAGVVLGRITGWLLKKLSRRTVTKWDDLIIDAIGSPLSVLWAIVLGFVAVSLLSYSGRDVGFLNTGLRTGLLITFFWILLRLVSVLGRNAETAAFSSSRPSMRALVPLAVRIGYFAVLAIGLVAVLADLGYPVASLVAGLGIGGLALALAAQKTVENLFGAFSISVDQPFSVGDTITVDGTTGEVQAIGLRSSRLRTQDRTVVTIPNGKLADMKVESFAPRDRIRLGAVLGLAYDTSSGQLRTILQHMEQQLRAHPKTFQDDVVVTFRAFGTEALEIEVNAYFLTTNYGEYRSIRQDMLLAFMEIVEKTGATFAFPPRGNVYLSEHAVQARKAAQ
jgi:MscS family membrane protein